MLANVNRPITIAAAVSRLTFNDADEDRADLGELDIADDVMIGPNVSTVTSGHPIDPFHRRASVIARPIVIERIVWIAAGATIIDCVTIGENSVVAASSVVSKSVLPPFLVC